MEHKRGLTKQLKYIELYNFMKIENLMRKDLADMLGIGVSTLNAYMNAHKPVQQEVIEKFCLLTGKTEDEVVAKPGDYGYCEPRVYESEKSRSKKADSKASESGEDKVIADISCGFKKPVSEVEKVIFTEDEARVFARKKQMFGESDLTRQAEEQWPQIFAELCVARKEGQVEGSVLGATPEIRKALIDESEAQKYRDIKKWVCELIMDGTREVSIGELVQRIVA